MALLGWVKGYWHKRQRRIDLEILWPCCLAAAENLDEARVVFAMHAYNDAAWLCLDPDELSNLISHLEDTRKPRYAVLPAEDLMRSIKQKPGPAE